MTQYEFRLSLRSNDPKVVFTGKYLNQFDDMRHRILSKMVDSQYPIALCLDRSKTDQEVLLAFIESLSNQSAQMAYQVNFLMADRGLNITPDMPSNFRLLPAIQYLPTGTNSIGIVDAASQNGNGSVSAYPAISSQSSMITDLQEVPIAKKAEEEDEYEEDDDEDEDDDESQMSDEEYLASKQHLLTLEKIK
jgi:hypothetical protein